MILLILTVVWFNAAAILRGWRLRSEASPLMVLQMQVCSLLWYATAGLGVAVWAVVHGSPYVI